jgi:hypothetical protein
VCSRGMPAFRLQKRSDCADLFGNSAFSRSSRRATRAKRGDCSGRVDNHNGAGTQFGEGAASNRRREKRET